MDMYVCVYAGSVVTRASDRPASFVSSSSRWLRTSDSCRATDNREAGTRCVCVCVVLGGGGKGGRTDVCVNVGLRETATGLPALPAAPHADCAYPTAAGAGEGGMGQHVLGVWTRVHVT
jgi:hypothetical protein